MGWKVCDLDQTAAVDVLIFSKTHGPGMGPTQPAVGPTQPAVGPTQPAVGPTQPAAVLQVSVMYKVVQI